MGSGGRVRLAMSLLAAALVLLAAELNQRRGVIRGIVRGPDGVPLAGARVVAETAPGETIRRPQVSVDTAEDGTYALHPRPGTFEVRVELDGLCAGGRPHVRVAEGETETVDFALQLVPVSQFIWVTFPPSEALARADAVVHLRIARSHEPRLRIPDISCGGGNVFTDHELEVIEAIKTEPASWPNAERVIFVQPRAGFYSDGRMTVRGPETPYVIGEEYVAFLHWSPERQRFISSAAPNAMVPVRSGRIVWRGKDEEGVRDGMPLAAFLDRLRELRD